MDTGVVFVGAVSTEDQSEVSTLHANISIGLTWCSTSSHLKVCPILVVALGVKFE